MNTLIGEDEIFRLLPFTDHKLRLFDDLWTLTEGGEEPRCDIRTKVVMERSGGSLKGKRILDLGCLEGGYAATFAQLGADQVVGVEARSLSIERCLLVKRLLGLNNCTFHRADVRTVNKEAFGEFDISFVAGLLYHLDDPFSFLLNVSRVTRDFALIDTHVARKDFWKHGCESSLITQAWNGRTYSGRIAHEYAPGASKAEVESLLWASYGNAASFWLTEESLVALLNDVGFQYVSKVYVPKGYRCGDDCPEPCRVVLVAKHVLPSVA